MNFSAILQKIHRPIAHLGLIAIIQVSSLALLNAYGTIDVDAYSLRGIYNISRHGLVQGLAVSRETSPPFNFVILNGALRMSSALHISPHKALKWTLWIFLLLAGLAIYFTTRDIKVTALFHGGMILSSMGLAYLDVCYMATLLLTLWFIKQERAGAALFFFTVSCLIKYLPLMFGPVLVLYLWRHKQITLRSIAPSIILLSATTLIFGMAFIDTFRTSLAPTSLSSQGLNFNWILTYVINYQFGHTYATLGIVVPPPIGLIPTRIIFLGTYLWVVYLGRRGGFAQMLQTAVMAYLTYFVLNSSVHENHLVTILPVAAFLAVEERKYFHEFVILALFANLGMLIFYGFDGQSNIKLGLPFVDLLVSVLMVLWYLIKFTRFRKAEAIHRMATQAAAA